MLPKILIPHESGLPLDDVLPPGLQEIQVHKDAPRAPTNFFAYEGKAYMYCEKSKTIYVLNERNVLGVLACGKSVAIFTEGQVVLQGDFSSGYGRSLPQYSRVIKRKITDYYVSSDCCMSCADGRLEIISMQEDISIPLRYTEDPLVQVQNLKLGEELLLPKDLFIEGHIHDFARMSYSLYNITLLDGIRISINVRVSPLGEDHTTSYIVTFSKVEPHALRIVHPIPLLPCSDAEWDSYSVEGVIKFSPPEHARKKSARK